MAWLQARGSSSPSRSQKRSRTSAKLSGASFGAAGTRVVIEEGLTGPELSLLCVCDGERIVPLAPARDYKRVGDGDEGPNTGGMGAFSPVPAVSDDLVAQILETIVEPTVGWLLRNDIDYRGVLYAGLMLTPAGPKAIEYNIRFGDPEAQVVLPRIASDLTALLAEAAEGRIRSPVVFSREAAVTVVCATEGYPLTQRSGDVIEGLDRLRDATDVHVYFAGVAEDGDRRLVTSGGRVLDVTSRGDDVADARSTRLRSCLEDLLAGDGVPSGRRCRRHGLSGSLRRTTRCCARQGRRRS